MDTKEAIEFLKSKKWDEGYYQGSVQEHNKNLLKIIELLKRGEKFEAMWNKFYKEWGEYPIELHNIAEFMDDIEQKYFPRPSGNFTEKVMDKIKNRKEG